MIHDEFEMKLLAFSLFACIFMQHINQVISSCSSLLSSIDPTNDFFDTAKIHLHVPEGSTPKDRPSAGCTIVSALVSLSLGRLIRQNIAMTGTDWKDITSWMRYQGEAAKRSDIRCVIPPQANVRDYRDLPDYIRDGMEVHFVNNYHDIYNIIFTS